MLLVFGQRGVGGEDMGCVAAGLEHPGADFEVVGAQHQDRVVKFASHQERPPRGAGGDDGVDFSDRCSSRGADSQRGTAGLAVDHDVDAGVVVAVFVDRARDGGQGDALGIGRAVALRGELGGALLDLFGEDLRFGVVVDQAPFLGALGADAFGQGAEDVGVVAAHAALVGDAGEAAGTWQHAEQRHLGQADGGGTVVDKQDLVAG